MYEKPVTRKKGWNIHFVEAATDKTFEFFMLSYA